MPPEPVAVSQRALSKNLLIRTDWALQQGGLKGTVLLKGCIKDQYELNKKAEL